jgi:hypothetical protein
MGSSLEKVFRIAPARTKSWLVGGGGNGAVRGSSWGNCVRWYRYFRLSSLASSFRRYSSRPFHPFASVVEERIISEVSLYGLRPGAWLGAWPSLLSQNRKDSCRRSRRKWKAGRHSFRCREANTRNFALSSVAGPERPREVGRRLWV